MTIAEVVKLIIDATREGPVSQWVDRIGEVARKAGLELSVICWQGDPSGVAFSVYQEAERHCKVQNLINACKTAT